MDAIETILQAADEISSTSTNEETPSLFYQISLCTYISDPINMNLMILGEAAYISVDIP